MPFVKVSHPKSQDPKAEDFFINCDHIVRMNPKDSGSLLFLRDGSTVFVEQAPDTIADYVEQLETNRRALVPIVQAAPEEVNSDPGAAFIT
ncbi:MAG: hypothetical protein JWN25_1488 [Verrucomicrobiales bacterium]|nr:hypothetical protein [Verrucomicrobiales bacterium]